MHPKDIKIADYNYELPQERIAQYPLSQRDASKLLIYRDREIREDTFRNIATHIPPNSLLIFNNTRVIHARLFFQTATGAKVEVFCLEPAEEQRDISLAMTTRKSCRWNCMIGRASKWKQKVLKMEGSEFQLTAEIVERNPDAFVVEFQWTPDELSFAEILDRAGQMPIPPYLKRSSEEIDESRYQTIFSKNEGSVAAPTAGLHFTEKVFDSLEKRGIKKAFLTLHVGAGTFKPVSAETIGRHEMHYEIISLSLEFIQNIRDSLSNPIIPVGTTSCRALESLYWMGVKTKLNPSITIEELEIKQWEVYEMTQQISPTEALDALIDWMTQNSLEHLVCRTQIMIAPPYQLKIANALITNFHQPSSTLLLLVAAIVGKDWKTIYDYALANDFRFLSYGDSSLIFPAG